MTTAPFTFKVKAKTYLFSRTFYDGTIYVAILILFTASAMGTTQIHAPI